jgi:type I restriction enzyme, S subunit
MGQSPPSDTYNTDRIGLPFYQGKAEFGDLYPAPVKWCSRPGKTAEAGDVLVSIRAPVGPTNLCRETSCIGRGLAALRPQAGMESLYFLYLLRHIEQKLAEQATGTTFAAIGGSVLRTQEIPLAPLPEQRRIVAEIEKQFTRLDAGVAALKRVQANLRRYRASVLKAACEGWLASQDPADEPADRLLARILAERRAKGEAEHPGKKYVEPAAPVTDVLPELPVGWCWTTVEQIADQRLGKMLDQVKNRGVLTPYLRNINVRWFRFDFSDIQEMRVTDEEIGDISVRVGDLVVCEGGEPGRAAVWTSTQESMVIQKALHRVRPAQNISPLYLAYRLAADATTGKLESYFTGSTIKHFTGQSLRSYTFPLPPMKEQHRIVAEVERRLSVVAAMEATVAANLARAGRLRQAVLKRAFEGRLVAQDAGDESAEVLLARIQTARTSVGA